MQPVPRRDHRRGGDRQRRGVLRHQRRRRPRDREQRLARQPGRDRSQHAGQRARAAAARRGDRRQLRPRQRQPGRTDEGAHVPRVRDGHRRDGWPRQPCRGQRRRGLRDLRRGRDADRRPQPMGDFGQRRPGQRGATQRPGRPRTGGALSGRRLLRGQRCSGEPTPGDRAPVPVRRRASIPRRRRVDGADDQRPDALPGGARRGHARRGLAFATGSGTATTDAGRSAAGPADDRGRGTERAATVHHPLAERHPARAGPDHVQGDRDHGDAAGNIVGRVAHRALRLHLAVRAVRDVGRRRDVGPDPAGVGADPPPHTLDAGRARGAVPRATALLRVRTIDRFHDSSDWSSPRAGSWSTCCSSCSAY